MSKTITVSDETFEKIKDQIGSEEKTNDGVKIYHVDGSVLYESSKYTTREAVEEAIENEANLREANLEGVNFGEPTLRKPIFGEQNFTEKVGMKNSKKIRLRTF